LAKSKTRAEPGNEAGKINMAVCNRAIWKTTCTGGFFKDDQNCIVFIANVTVFIAILGEYMHIYSQAAQSYPVLLIYYVISLYK
jgi:hypothetical protein